MRKLSKIKDLTIDVGIVMMGCRIGNPDSGGRCRSLMDKVKGASSWYLALDQGGKIRHQYEVKLRHSTYWLKWMTELGRRGKLRFFKWTKIDKGTITQLKEQHFDWEDFKYVRTAWLTECGILVASTPCYSPEIRRILRKRLSVFVRQPIACLDL